jgi:hypothetical protein
MKASALALREERVDVVEVWDVERERMRGSGDRRLLYLNPCRGVKSVKAVGECSVPVPGTSKCQAVAPSKAR